MLLLDTDALIWAEIASPRLGPKAQIEITNAVRARRAYLCPISFWETELAIQRNRIQLTVDIVQWRQDLLAAGYQELPVSGADTIAMARLPGVHADPADRLIVAVALNHGISLITSDEKILGWTASLVRCDARL